MLALRYLLIIIGIGLFGSAGALVAYDVFLSSQLNRLLRRWTSAKEGEESAALPPGPFVRARWGLAQRLAAAGGLPLFLAAAPSGGPPGFAGVRVSQMWGARPRL